MNLPQPSPPLALVIPWFGAQQTGGAERQAFELAQRLRAREINLEVITTTGRSHNHSWETNFFAPGFHEESGIAVRRFPLEKRRAQAFNQVVAKLLAIPLSELRPGISPLASREERIYADESINSPQLLDYLASQSDRYRCFIFLPYLFPLLQKAISLVRGKAILQPCLHHEAYAFLHQTAETFARAQTLLFNSPGEYQLAVHLYGEWISKKSQVIGEGIDEDPPPSAAPEEQPSRPSVLYLGKKSPEKNIALLIHGFDRYRNYSQRPMELVMAGALALPSELQRPYIRDLGFVSPREKHRLLQQCRVLAMPSRNESFSRVMYEAWLAEKPVIVHSECLATYAALRAADFPGWAGCDAAQWAEILGQIEQASPQELGSLGRKGRAYAAETTNWPKIIDRYLEVFELIAASSPSISPSDRPSRPTLLFDSSVEYAPLHHGELANLARLIEDQNGTPILVSRNPAVAKLTHRCATLTLGEASNLRASVESSTFYFASPRLWREALRFTKVLPGKHYFRTGSTDGDETPLSDLNHFDQLLCRSLSEKKILVKRGVNEEKISLLPTFITPRQIAGNEVNLSLFRELNRKEVNILLADNYLLTKSRSALIKLLSSLCYHHHLHLQLLIPTVLSNIPWGNLKYFRLPMPIRITFLPKPGEDFSLTQVLLADLLLSVNPLSCNNLLALTCCYYGVPIMDFTSEFSTSTLAATIKKLIYHTSTRRNKVEEGYAYIQEFQLGNHQQRWRDFSRNHQKSGLPH